MSPNPPVFDPALTRKIRATLSARHIRRDRLALLMVSCDAILFFAFVTLAVMARSHALRALGSLAAGFVTLRLAAIAHDAGHHSYTSSRITNKIIARLAFLPALQPFATWAVAHNIIHHSWASIRGKDYVWIPFSREAFERLPLFRRLLERLYRSPWGHGFYYLIHLWLLRVAVPGFRWSEIPRRAHRLDILLTAAFAVTWGAVAMAAAHALGRDALAALFYGEIAPFLVWSELFGLTLYLEHTHPSTRFFRSRSEWEFYSSQTASATAVEFPRWFGWLLLGLFDHTAHHLDTSIPLYEIHEAQHALNNILAGANVVYRWSWREFLRCCRVCKLYDYERHFWLDFRGNVTAIAGVRDAHLTPCQDGEA